MVLDDNPRNRLITEVVNYAHIGVTSANLLPLDFGVPFNSALASLSMMSLYFDGLLFQ